MCTQVLFKSACQLEVKYSDVNKENNLHIANNNNNPLKLPKRGQNMHKYPHSASVP
jgi:hypothetical protein